MTAPGFALFDTAIGRCGIAWGASGICGVHLPEASSSATRRRMLLRYPEVNESAPPPVVQRAIDRIVTLLRGEATDLEQIALDMSLVPAFHRRVYELARKIPAGRTLSYGEVASRIGSPGAARAVGQALGKNPFAIVVPCHRVLAAGGKPGGFSASGGIDTKLKMLRIEQAQRGLFDGDGELGFDLEQAVETLRASDPKLARVIARRAVPFATQEYAQYFRRARRVDRVSAAARQSRGDDFCPRSSAVPASARRADRRTNLER